MIRLTLSAGVAATVLLAGAGSPAVIGAPARQARSALAGVPTFEVAANWPTLPADFTWGQVIGIFADPQGHVWTSSRSRIAEWAQDGTLIQSWDARGPNGNWSTIHGLFVDHNGFVWTNARESHLTVKFTRTGQVAMVIGKYNETGGSNDTALMGRPSDIWVDPADNEVFVADGYGNRRVIVFDGATGKYLRHWGAYGRRPEDPPRATPSAGAAESTGASSSLAVPSAPPPQLRVPHGILGSPDGLIYVADRANNRIQVFRQTGEFVREKILRPHCGVEEKASWAPKRPSGTEAAFFVAVSHDGPLSYEIYGSRCRVGDPNPCCKHTIFGEGVCPFLKETCTNPNVDCKLWFCETAINNMDPECIESFKALEQLARVHKLIRTPFLGQPYVGADKQPK